MKGTLSDQPLAELIREIFTKELSGTLRLEHERAKSAVYFEKGEVVYAASNLRTLRLREYLIKRGVLAEKDQEMNPSDLDLAAALRAKGALTQREIDGLLTTQVSDILRVTLLWTEGTWDFNERARLNDPVRVKVESANLLREAAQRLPLKFVSQRFRNPSEMISRAHEVSGLSNFLPAESFMLSRLDKPIKLEELVPLSGLRELDAYRVIYGLVLSGSLKREYWQNAFRTEGAKANTEPAPTIVAPPIQTGEPSVTENLWTFSNSEDDDLEKFLRRLKNATNYYEVIELPSTAKASEIKDAYYALARRYHPDRFHLKSGTKLHAQISSGFARITQAYETLTDPKTRTAYDQNLERSRQFSESAPKATQTEPAADPAEDFDIDDDGSESEFGRAEYSFREGFGALQQGRISAAVTHLAAASRLAPNEARYRAYYGRALAAHENTRRLAENEMQAAVKLEPANAAFRIMLAELYFDLKFHRRAQTELDRALALDPNSATAHALLRKLQRTRKAG
jgi:curved DNA-binding protein CbpA